MKIRLQITDGPAAGQQLEIAQDQSLKVGRSPEADFGIPDDLEMSSLHFEVVCNEHECLVRDLGSTNETFLNQKQITESVLHDGDQLRSGQSLFSVQIHSGETPAITDNAMPTPSAVVAAAPAAIATDGETAATDADGFLAMTVQEISEPIDFDSEEAPKLLQEKQSPQEYLEALTQQELLSDALRFLAYALPKREAVWWAALCVRRGSGESLTDEDASALEATEQWVKEPTEDNRRAAMKAAEAGEFGTAACWPAVGAFWSGGSMGPPDTPVVPPGDDLTGKAVSGAVMVGAVLIEPEKAAEKQREFIRQGLAVAAGERHWERAD